MLMLLVWVFLIVFAVQFWLTWTLSDGLDFVPMQWDPWGVPTWSAPRAFACACAPGVGAVVVLLLAWLLPSGQLFRAVLALAGVISVLAITLHLVLLRRWRGVIGGR